MQCMLFAEFAMLHQFQTTGVAKFFLILFAGVGFVFAFGAFQVNAIVL